MVREYSMLGSITSVLVIVAITLDIRVCVLTLRLPANQDSEY